MKRRRSPTPTAAAVWLPCIPGGTSGLTCCCPSFRWRWSGQCARTLRFVVGTYGAYRRPCCHSHEWMALHQHRPQRSPCAPLHGRDTVQQVWQTHAAAAQRAVPTSHSRWRQSPDLWSCRRRRRWHQSALAWDNCPKRSSLPIGQSSRGLCLPPLRRQVLGPALRFVFFRAT